MESLIKLARTKYPERITDEVIMRSEEYQNALKSLQQSEWVSVEDRLPELKQGVLVCLNNGFITVAYLIETESHRKWQIFGDLDTFLVDYKDKVTHWMPLPEQPKLLTFKQKKDENTKNKSRHKLIRNSC